MGNSDGILENTFTVSMVQHPTGDPRGCAVSILGNSVKTQLDEALSRQV